MKMSEESQREEKIARSFIWHPPCVVCRSVCVCQAVGLATELESPVFMCVCVCVGGCSVAAAYADIAICRAFDLCTWLVRCCGGWLLWCSGRLVTQASERG